MIIRKFLYSVLLVFKAMLIFTSWTIMYASEELTIETPHRNLNLISSSSLNSDHKLLNLPDEAALLIFYPLILSDLGKVAQVCKKWQTLSEDPSIWKPIAQQMGLAQDYTLFIEWDKSKVAAHLLRVKVNMLSDKNAIKEVFRCHARFLFTPHISLRIFIDPILMRCDAYKDRLSLLREVEGEVGIVESHVDRVYKYALKFDPEKRRQADNNSLQDNDLAHLLSQLTAHLKECGKRGIQPFARISQQFMDEGFSLGCYQGFYGAIMKKLYGENGVEPDLQDVSMYISSFANDNDRLAQYLKAFSMLFGCLGFNKDSETAYTYMRRHKIAY